jgi:hypothetical protein
MLIVCDLAMRDPVRAKVGHLEDQQQENLVQEKIQVKGCSPAFFNLIGQVN